MDRGKKMELWATILILFWIVIVISIYLFLYGSPEFVNFIARLGYEKELFYFKIDFMKLFHE